MIISASRRTDIPAFYTDWFMERIRAGYCTVPNPYNPRQVSHVSLRPADVDVIVLWTRHPLPLMRYLTELDDLGYRYYFQYTLLGYPRLLEPRRPTLERSIEVFRKLAGRVGPARVIWRYDPIILSALTNVEYHEEIFGRIARSLQGYTQRCVLSFVDEYVKTRVRLRALEAHGLDITYRGDGMLDGDTAQIAQSIAEMCSRYDIAPASCAESPGLERYGISPGKCVDDVYIRSTFGIDVSGRKDPAQRAACGCVISKDIGTYGTCLFGCKYCYATDDFERARRNYARRDPTAVALAHADRRREGER